MLNGMTAISRIGLAAALAFAMSSASAQDFGAQVAVPEDGGRSRDCYQFQERIYGPYRMAFCLNSRNGGRYRVMDGDLDCRAELTWSQAARNRIRIDLTRATCGAGMAWSADTLICRTGDAGRASDAMAPQVAVPDHGGRDALVCRYLPSERGFEEITVVAVRQNR